MQRRILLASIFAVGSGRKGARQSERLTSPGRSNVRRAPERTRCAPPGRPPGARTAKSLLRRPYFTGAAESKSPFAGQIYRINS